jgi:hypothetical protein
LNARGVGHSAHEAVERIDLAHEMALAQAAYGRVAGHRADLVGAQRHQRGIGAEARGCAGRLAPGMAASDDDDIKTLRHSSFSAIFWGTHVPFAGPSQAADAAANSFT